jgi:hypothetical protein
MSAAGQRAAATCTRCQEGSATAVGLFEVWAQSDVPRTFRLAPAISRAGGTSPEEASVQTASVGEWMPSASAVVRTTTCP